MVQGTVTSSLSYDDDGRRTKLVLPNGIGVLYSYDVASRLTSIVYQASSTNYIAYGYDSTGKRASQASVLSAYLLPSAVSNSTYDAANHQLTFGTYNMLYDLDGNVTNIVNGTTTNTLLWSARNQLTNMLGAVTANFLYDALGRRITRTIGSTTEKYAYDGIDIIQQLNNTAQSVRTTSAAWPLMNRGNGSMWAAPTRTVPTLRMRSAALSRSQIRTLLFRRATRRPIWEYEHDGRRQ